MFKLFSVILFSLLITSESQAVRCESLFGIYGEPNANKLKFELESNLLNDLMLSKIDKIRRKYDGLPASIRSSPTIQLISILRVIEDLPYKRSRSEHEKVILEMGIDNLIDDLVHISPTYLSTTRIVVENIAIMIALVAREGSKAQSQIKSEDKNVFVLSPERVKMNSEYLTAKREAFEIVESYRMQDYIPSDIRIERVEELLFIDHRYQHLTEELRSNLLSQVLSSLKRIDGESAEKIFERFFLSQSKVRTQS